MASVNNGADWIGKNKRAGAIFIEHTLQVADFMTRPELACAEIKEMELMREHEIVALAAEKTRQTRDCVPNASTISSLTDRCCLAVPSRVARILELASTPHSKRLAPSRSDRTLEAIVHAF